MFTQWAEASLAGCHLRPLYGTLAVNVVSTWQQQHLGTRLPFFQAHHACVMTPGRCRNWQTCMPLWLQLKLALEVNFYLMVTLALILLAVDRLCV